MTEKITIALDAMGGDHGVSVVVPAAVNYLKAHPDQALILVGKEDAIREQLSTDSLPLGLTIQEASQEVGMNELPSQALRKKKDSSMRVALNLVKDGVADACVSAGNTGALMATARFVLKMLPNVDRPAIITALPAMNGRTWMLDLGANVDCSAQHLFQFAVMGSELVTVIDEIPEPKVGLLNIGQEEIKGNEQVKGAHELLRYASLNYIGYVEGDDIYLNEEVDIVVTDGFIGNVALKTSEGVAKMIRANLKEGFERNILTKLSALIALPVLKRLSRRIDPRRYNGASLLGLRGVVVKSHGGTDVLGYAHAIDIAAKAVRADIAARIEKGVSRHLDNQRISA
ncbi:MAG TPA: phosphate acyltransferase PlsX [Thiolapillus brandeum]|uniref:Phosphate acyltransferase n=1 Tax=Thiolapillus brandeum TaxID=1076588 RepID=A0A831K9R9_9GAMM|nr:phosphate acyltransferase PlsX [Thiolapillus brandeum]